MNSTKKANNTVIMLNDKEVRVLGSLIEKELSTPDYYPLSVNALTNACNQKSSRDPVVSYLEQTVEGVVDDLVRKDLVHKSRVGRVPKVEERFTHKNNLVPRESAVLCVLMLRGPQTVGEIKGRTGRLCKFDSLDEVLETLGQLEEYGLVGCLPRQPGHKESRYIQLLSGELEIDKEETVPVAGHDLPVESERIEKVEQEIRSLRNDFAELKREFHAFKKQFD